MEDVCEGALDTAQHQKLDIFFFYFKKGGSSSYVNDSQSVGCCGNHNFGFGGSDLALLFIPCFSLPY